MTITPRSLGPDFTPVSSPWQAQTPAGHSSGCNFTLSDSSAVCRAGGDGTGTHYARIRTALLDPSEYILNGETFWLFSRFTLASNWYTVVMGGGHRILNTDNAGIGATDEWRIGMWMRSTKTWRIRAEHQGGTDRQIAESPVQYFAAGTTYELAIKIKLATTATGEVDLFVNGVRPTNWVQQAGGGTITFPRTNVATIPASVTVANEQKVSRYMAGVDGAQAQTSGQLVNTITLVGVDTSNPFTNTNTIVAPAASARAQALPPGAILKSQNRHIFAPPATAVGVAPTPGVTVISASPFVLVRNV